MIERNDELRLNLLSIDFKTINVYILLSFLNCSLFTLLKIKYVILILFLHFSIVVKILMLFLEEFNGPQHAFNRPCDL